VVAELPEGKEKPGTIPSTGHPRTESHSSIENSSNPEYLGTRTRSVSQDRWNQATGVTCQFCLASGHLDEQEIDLLSLCQSHTDAYSAGHVHGYLTCERQLLGEVETRLLELEEKRLDAAASEIAWQIAVRKFTQGVRNR